MKFWKKIYFAVFSLFLIFLNTGIFLVFYISYSGSLNEEKTRLTGEGRMICTMFKGDVSAFGDKRVSERDIRLIMSDYEENFKQNQLSFRLFRNDEPVFCSEGFTEGKEKQENAITIARENGVQTAYLITVFEINGDRYRLDIMRPLEAVTQIWDKLKWIFLFLSAGLSVILAAVLYVIMRRLTSPLNRLSHLTREIAAGNYEQIENEGTDEIAELGRDFNVMTAAVQNKIESQQRFVANLAHELRTPLTSIHGYAGYLLLGNMDEERKIQALHYIDNESRRMQQMTKQLLLLARVQEEPFEMDNVSVEECLREAYGSSAPLAEQKQLTVRMEGEDFCVPGVSELLICLFRNLFENAVRACRMEGEIDAGWGDGTVRIRDNGIGMEPEELEKITEPFYRIDKARSRNSGGTGLGLALCREIADLHHAVLEYESIPGEGTTVRIIFTK